MNNFYRTEKGLIPAIPEPYYGLFKKCECGKRYLTKKGYERHYILKHTYQIN